MLKSRIALLPLVVSFAAFAGAPAAAVTLTFDDIGLVHGSVVDTQYAGVTISAINTGGGPNLAVAFDTDLTGTRDDDLEFGTGWAAGNLAPDTKLGKLIIIQENTIGCSDGVCDAPDDEGSRPAGTLIFDFDVAVTSFGFDLVDVESLASENGSLTLYDGATSVDIPMSSLLAGLSLGNNSANRIDALLVPTLNGFGPLAQITKAELNLAGSAGIDNVTFTPVPEPSTAALLALGAAVLGARARSRR